MSEPVLTVEQAEDLAARTLDVIDSSVPPSPWHMRTWVADRERIASDLRAFRRAEDGLGEHVTVWSSLGPYCVWCHMNAPCSDARRYTEERADAWASLVRTADLYGVKP